MSGPGLITVTWDGKDFAVIQMLPLPRKPGMPYATVDQDWNLYLKGIPVPVGTVITVDPVSGACAVDDGFMEPP
jgi:hypothetical protein